MKSDKIPKIGVMTNTIEKCEEKEETQYIKKCKTWMIKEKKVSLIKRGSERKYKNHEGEHTLHFNILCYLLFFDLDSLEETFENELNATIVKLIFYAKQMDTIQPPKQSRDDD